MNLSFVAEWAKRAPKLEQPNKATEQQQAGSNVSFAW